MLLRSRPASIAGAISVLCFVAILYLYHADADISLSIGQFSNPFRSFSPATSPSHALEPIVVVMVVIGASSALEGQHMIKSIILHASRPIQLHLVCSQDAVDVLKPLFALVPRPILDLDVSFWIVSPEQVWARGERAGLGTTHHAGVGGLVKLFLHEIIRPSVPRALYVDTDAMFLSDPAILWDEFLDSLAVTDGAPDKVISLTHGGIGSLGSNMCTCTMGLEFSALRAAPFLPSPFLPDSNDTALGNTQTWAEAQINPKSAPWGDQGIVWAVFRRFPDRFGRLSRSWDANACRAHHGMALDADQNRTVADERKAQDAHRAGDDADAVPETGLFFPGILHFNCIPSEESIFENEGVLKQNKWGSYVLYIARYKWVWLNRGRASSTARTTVDETRVEVFWDELQAGGPARSARRAR